MYKSLRSKPDCFTNRDFIESTNTFQNVRFTTVDMALSFDLPYRLYRFCRGSSSPCTVDEFHPGQKYLWDSLGTSGYMDLFFLLSLFLLRTNYVENDCA